MHQSDPKQFWPKNQLLTDQLVLYSGPVEFQRGSAGSAKGRPMPMPKKLPENDRASMVSLPSWASVAPSVCVKYEGHRMAGIDGKDDGFNIFNSKFDE